MPVITSGGPDDESNNILRIDPMTKPMSEMTLQEIDEYLTVLRKNREVTTAKPRVGSGRKPKVGKEPTTDSGDEEII